MSAREIQTAVQTSASRTRTSCALRLKTPRSRASMPRTKATKPLHNQGLPMLAGLMFQAKRGSCAEPRLGPRTQSGRARRRYGSFVDCQATATPVAGAR